MFSDAVALIRRPLGVLNTLDAERPLSVGLVALLLSVLLPAIVSELAAFGPFRPPAELGSLPTMTAQGADLYARWSYEHRFLLPMYGVVISLLLWLLAVGLIHGIARALQGRAGFLGFLKLAGYIALLGLIVLPFQVLDAIARLSGNAGLENHTAQLAGLLGLGVFLWQNILLIYAARQHYSLSTERAVAAVIGPIGGVAVLGLAVVIVGAIVFVLMQTS